MTISNGVGTIASNFTIVVACQLNLAKLAPKLNFAKTNSDSCTVTGSFDLPADIPVSPASWRPWTSAVAR